jgi:hypothetical protein
MFQIGQKEENGWLVKFSDFVWELRLLGVIEVLGLIEQYRIENFDFSQPVSINFKGPLLKSEDGRRYRPNSPDEIEDPKARADYIEKTKKIKAYAKRYNYQYALKRGWESWMGLFHLSIYGQITNQGDNAVDREKVKVVYELVRTANITEQSKQKLRFWLTMMVECDKSLVKKAREENDQTCAEYVKELHGDSSVGDSSVGNAQRHKRS